MTNILRCGEFSGQYNGLSGVRPLTASHLDITRAMLTIGYASRWRAIQNTGFWRALQMYSMMRGYLDHNLSTTRYFRNLEQSEKGGMSFLLGQAFTYWFAQNHMGVSYVVHVRGAREIWTPATSSMAMKRGAGPLKPRARPDFIGRSVGQYHVFESKGRSNRLSRNLMAGALSQASMITSINGQTPETRVAACFSFLASGVRGHVIDPPAAPAALSLEFDDVTAAEKTYAFFLQPHFRESASELVSGFTCVDLGNGLIFGVDSKVMLTLDDLRSTFREERTAEPLLQLLDQRRDFYAERRIPANSVGNEGIILSGTSTL